MHPSLEAEPYSCSRRGVHLVPRLPPIIGKPVEPWLGSMAPQTLAFRAPAPLMSCYWPRTVTQGAQKKQQDAGRLAIASLVACPSTREGSQALEGTQYNTSDLRPSPSGRKTSNSCLTCRHNHHVSSGGAIQLSRLP